LIPDIQEHDRGASLIADPLTGGHITIHCSAQGYSEQLPTPSF